MNAADPLDAPLNADEIREMHRLMPGSTRIDEKGYIVPLLTRREVFRLEQRYGGSMDPRRVPPSVKTDNAEQDALAARYPSMYRPKKP